MGQDQSKRFRPLVRLSPVDPAKPATSTTSATSSTLTLSSTIDSLKARTLSSGFVLDIANAKDELQRQMERKRKLDANISKLEKEIKRLKDEAEIREKEKGKEKQEKEKEKDREKEKQEKEREKEARERRKRAEKKLGRSRKERDEAKRDRSRCLEFFEKHIVQIIKERDGRAQLLTMDQEPFEELLKSDNLAVGNEAIVFRLVLSWAFVRAEQEYITLVAQEETKAKLEKEKKEKGKEIEDDAPTKKKQSRGATPRSDSQPQSQSQSQSPASSASPSSTTTDDEMAKLLLADTEAGASDNSSNKSQVDGDEKATTVDDDQDKDNVDVDLRGSDGLYRRYSKGVAKLLERNNTEASATNTVAGSTATAEASGNSDDTSPLSSTSSSASSTDGKDKRGSQEGDKDEHVPKEKNDASSTEDDEEDDEKKAKINLRGTAGLYAHMSGQVITKKEKMRPNTETEQTAVEDQESETKEKDVEPESSIPSTLITPMLLSPKAPSPASTSPSTSTATPTPPTPGSPSTSTSASTTNEPEEIDLPDWAETPEHIARVKKYMLPLLPHIRFNFIAPSLLEDIDDSKLVPDSYIIESFRYRALTSLSPELLDPLDKRVGPRKYSSNVTFDPSWHGQNIVISADGKTASKSNQSWYSVACGREGFSTGRHTWAVKVEGDEAYVGVTAKSIQSMDNYLGLVGSYAYRTAYKSSGYGGSSYYGEAFGRGDIITVVLDFTKRELSFCKNGKNQGVAFTNIAYDTFYPAVGWRGGQMVFVDAEEY